MNIKFFNFVFPFQFNILLLHFVANSKTETMQIKWFTYYRLIIITNKTELLGSECKISRHSLKQSSYEVVQAIVSIACICAYVWNEK